MNRKWLPLMIALPLLAPAQTKLGPFTFLNDSRARNLTVNLAIGETLQGALSMEIPSLAALAVFDFIPGYANRLFASTDGSSLYAEIMITARARYRPQRRFIALMGLGPGLGISAKSFKPTVSVILGIDYLLTEKYVLTADIRSAGMLTVGIGWHNGYGWR